MKRILLSTRSHWRCFRPLDRSGRKDASIFARKYNSPEASLRAVKAATSKEPVAYCAHQGEIIKAINESEYAAIFQPVNADRALIRWCVKFNGLGRVRHV